MSGIIAASSALSTPFMVGSAIVLVLEILAFWMIFFKAGRPGWAAIIPIYNLYTMCKVAGRPARVVVDLVPDPVRQHRGCLHRLHRDRQSLRQGDVLRRDDGGLPHDLRTDPRPRLLDLHLARAGSSLIGSWARSQPVGRRATTTVSMASAGPSGVDTTRIRRPAWMVSRSPSTLVTSSGW